MKFDPNKHAWYVIGFAAIVSGLFTAAIMALHLATEPIVQANQRLLTEKAVVEVFGLGDVEQLSAREVSDLIRRRVAGLVDPNRPDDPRAQPIPLRDPDTGDQMDILVAYKTDLPAGRLPDIHDRTNIIGYAFPIGGVGFWARIDGYLAVTPDGDRARGIVFTRHQETPGLGGRITEKAFRKQFEGLNVSPPPQDGAFVSLTHQKLKAFDPNYDRHVDAITGATGTSTAVDKFLNEDIRRFRRIAAAAGLWEATSR